MCGIAGIIGLPDKKPVMENILPMTDKIAHRGPDGEGYLITNLGLLCEHIISQRPDSIVISKDHRQYIALGHRRLSILDLHDNAAQPMSDLSGRYWIVFNGEIYNHAELRKQLEKLGCKFQTDHSDTEVILNAYAQWGRECLTRFNGMWAFCIWDSHENTIFIARDTIGKKPLYYTETENALYFASELKALLLSKEIPRVLNERAIYDYLTYTMVPAPETIFRDIKKLSAAHYLYFMPGERPQAKRYWSPFRTEKYLDENEAEITEELREKINEAVRIRLVADVEVGLLLSGGLDSSINLALASRQNAKPIKAFCIGFENISGYQNEFKYARRVADFFKADYHELRLTEKEYFSFMAEMAHYLDEPTADIANIPLYYISKMARHHGVKVLLSGEGSDELFIGYQLWEIARRFEAVMKGKPLLSTFAGLLHRNSPIKNKRKYYHNWYGRIRKNQPVFWSGTEQTSEKEKESMLSEDFLRTMGDYDSFSPINGLHESFKTTKHTDSFDWMSSVDLAYRLPELLLARLDRMTMAASVEGRNPFLDVNLIEYIMRIPPGLKTRNNQEKYILKKTFEGILPEEIIQRRKNSFSAPLDHIFNIKENKHQCFETIVKFNEATNTFSQEYLQQLKHSTNGNNMYMISTLAYWYDQFARS